MNTNLKNYFLITMISILAQTNFLFSQISNENWPTKNWIQSLPEEQGIDSEKLVKMLEEINEKNYQIRHLSIIRNGYLILTTDFYPFPENTWHIINSCTKSIISVLIGIAIDQGYIKNIQTPLLEIFSELEPENINESKQKITLKHVLNMSSGLDTKDSYFYGFQGLRSMTSSANWIKYIIDQPMAHNPGEKFEYSNCSSFLLSAILHEACKKDLLTFARESLFDPLGIKEIDWWRGYHGIPLGWAGIRMQPLDLAKIGLLYLNKGNWNGQQIVSSNWIDTSTRKHINTGQIFSDIFMEGYGYHWWVDELDNYAAIGFGGQYLIVSPKNNLVVVFNSALGIKNFTVPQKLFKEYILPACNKSYPVTKNTGAEKRLQAILKKVKSPNPTSTQPLAKMAKLISSKKYAIDPNPSSFKAISLTFNDSSRVAQLKLAFGQKQIDVEVGLDDNYRLTKSAGYLRAYKGKWIDDSTFEMEYHVLDYSEHGKLSIQFKNEKHIEGRVYEYVENVNHKISGQILN